VCGDCTDPATVARVMGGERAHAVLTDPPYALGDSWQGLQVYRGNKQVANDNRGDWDAWFTSFLDTLPAVLADNAVGYFWYALRTNVRQMVEAKGYTVHAVLIWVKEHYNVGRADYHSQYEPCLYFSTGIRFWCGRRDISDVWNANRVEQERLHPTQKPLSLIELSINNSTETGAIVYEPFDGSGTCIIACENTGRRCRAIEIDAGFTAVALERWATHTGKTPVLIG
jgi:DNA modification methylase